MGDASQQPLRYSRFRCRLLCTCLQHAERARVKAQKLRYQKSFAFGAVGPPQKVKQFIRRLSRLQHVVSRPLQTPTLRRSRSAAPATVFIYLFLKHVNANVNAKK